MVKPFSPLEASKARVLPDEVVSAFNDWISKNYRRGRSSVRKNEVIGSILINFGKSGKPVKRQEIIDNGWLDVEEIYEAEGWDVDYEDSERGDSEGYYTFESK